MECGPFGLATAVSAFKYLMSQVLTGLNHFTFTYLDDILIFFNSWKNTWNVWKLSSNRFKSASLKVKISKCQFSKKHLHYLGHKISAEGLEPLPEKLEAIKNLAPAKNTDEAHQILGLLGYYQSFAPAFTDITLSITNLLKKNVPFDGLQKCQASLGYLKEIFCSKPVLQFPDANKKYVLYTDASNSGYSGVLCQPQDNENNVRPVAYFIRNLHSTEQKLVCCREGSLCSTPKI